MAVEVKRNEGSSYQVEVTDDEGNVALIAKRYTEYLVGGGYKRGIRISLPNGDLACSSDVAEDFAMGLEDLADYVAADANREKQAAVAREVAAAKAALELKNAELKKQLEAFQRERVYYGNPFGIRPLITYA